MPIQLRPFLKRRLFGSAPRRAAINAVSYTHLDTVAARCDFAFTSPPYFRKEHYSEDDTQSWVRYKTGDAWRDGFLAPMMALQHAALKPGCRSLINIADVKIGSKTYPLVEWTKQAAARVGLAYERTLEFPLARRFGAVSYTHLDVYKRQIL